MPGTGYILNRVAEVEILSLVLDVVDGLNGAIGVVRRVVNGVASLNGSMFSIIRRRTWLALVAAQPFHLFCNRNNCWT